jgi:hypothetical protein
MKQQYDCVWLATDGLVERHHYMRDDIARAVVHYRKNKSWIDGYLVSKVERGFGIYDKDMNCLKFFIKRNESHL